MKKLIALSALTVLSATAFAETKTENGLSYNEIGVGYVSQKLTGDTSTNTFKGYSVSASALVTESIFLFGGYTSTSHDFVPEGKVTLGDTKLGLGYRMPLSDNTDLNLIGHYSSATVTSSNNITATGLGVGIKTLALSPDLETTLAYVYYSQKDGSTTTNESGFTLGGKYKLPGNFFLNVEYLSTKDNKQYVLGGGYRF